MNITGTIASSSSNSASATTSPTSVSTSQCKKGTSVTAVGVGVAVPLGILLLLALVWGFYERKRGRVARGAEYGSIQQPQQYQQDHKALSQELGGGGGVRQELPPDQRPNELAG